MAGTTAVKFSGPGLPNLPYNQDKSFIIKEISTPSKIECAAQCSAHGGCSAIMFKTADMDGERCISTASYLDYTGKWNITFNGKTCQRWDTNSPHYHGLGPTYLPENSMADAENYCRDPDLSGYLWCYTTDPSDRWQGCNIWKCFTSNNNCRLYSSYTQSVENVQGYGYYSATP
ncbi:plasminogen-like [Mya arenaria]|uniref:plasminogen-like n=1 Tax=Mya arenaria TaxID=6604 RepID=UPI0022E65C68|nr:plasminogen-like [Mya arenaria]